MVIHESIPIDVVLPERAALGECPLWDGRIDRLYWIDIDGLTLHRTDPATGTDEVVEMPGRPGSMVLTDDIDRFVVAVEHRIIDVVWSTGVCTDRLVIEPDDRVTRFNDGRCDAAGRYWVGTMEDPAASRTFAGSLYRIDDLATGDFTTARTDVGITNGLAFSPDGETMYWADSNHGTVWAYDYDLATGSQSNERVFLDFDDLPGLPDGACVDADGRYWVACVTGNAVLCATPDGTVERIIDLPVSMPTMPAFGGPALDTLFITSIAAGNEIDGALLALDVGARGVAEPRMTS
jgi:sugar lactone lactonase YvrE